MLTPEQVKALQARRNYLTDQPRRLQAIASIPESLRPTAYGLLYHDEHGKPLEVGYEHQERRNALQRRALAQLDDLAPADRLQIFTAFYPSIANTVELAWVQQRGLPYTRALSYHAEFFRAPSHPEVTLEARGVWLMGLPGSVGPQDDLSWLARHGAYLGVGGNQLGLLFAAAIDGDPVRGPEIFEILARSARGEDEIGTFGRHIPLALLAADRPDGWELVARLLLGAQREEGVRQTILSTLDVAHPGALRHILGVILDERLVRFSAVTRMINQWLRTAWDSDKATVVTQALRGLATMLDDPAARAAAVTRGSGEDAYLALWATACGDIYAALPLAERLLDDADAARRYAGARLLASAYIPEVTGPLLRALADRDARVAAVACEALRYADAHYNNRLSSGAVERADAFERIEALLPSLPAPLAQPQPPLWNAPVPALDREQVADLLLTFLGERDPRRLLPYLGQLSGFGRAQAAERLAEHCPDDPTARAALLGLLGDRVSYMRNRAFKLLAAQPIQPGEAQALEALLKRAAADLRQSALRLLLAQSDDSALASARRLLAMSGAAGARQRLAGLEALRLLHEAGRARTKVAAQAASYRQRHPTLTPAEEALLAPVLENARDVPTLENALGLVRLEELTPPTPPQPRAYQWTSPAVVAGLQALDELIHQRRAETYTIENWAGRQEVVLGADLWRFPQPDAKVAIAGDLARLPFLEVWRAWAEARGAALRDADRLEFARMLIQLYQRGANETRAVLAIMNRLAAGQGAGSGDGDGDAPRLSLRYPAIIEKLIWWLIRLYPPTGGADLLLDHLETILTEIPERELREPEDGQPRYRSYQKLDRAVTLARSYATYLGPGAWNAAHDARLWRLLAWSATLPQPHLRYRPQTREALLAHAAGAASEADLLYQFLGPRLTLPYRSTSFDELHTFSARKPHALLSEFPIAGAIYARCMRRVLEVELGRGETPTAATDAALSLRALSGGEIFLAILRALGEERFARGYSYDDRSKARTLSHLLRVTFPGPEDTPEAFSALARSAKIPERRLVEAAVYAPQWGQHIERALGWKGFAQGVWWVHAHTKGRNWSVEQEIREEWTAAISQRTPLAAADLYDGAVDVAWFRRVIATLGEARWETLYQAAAYASGGTGHSRARLFADALLGRVDEAALSARIRDKRNRDAACALGLLALPKAAARRKNAVLARYQTLQEFIRTARAFGAQRREGDQTAARIGLDNLARTAGYADPARFQWAMELEEVADLAAGPLTVTHDSVTVTLAVDPLGQPRLSVEKAGRPLKEIPPRLKKDAAVVALRERKTALERQSARMRAALEQVMLRADSFSAAELAGLLRHPLLAPMLEQLVFTGPAGMGYLIASATALRAPDGDARLAPDAALRIAHPYDLYALGQWSAWQRECVVAERIQPFKQVYRELYLVTEAERREGGRSLRYAGQQVQPQQALALLAARGWLASAEDGYATRTFHDQGVSVAVDYLSGGGTPVDVEGLTIESVSFHQAGEQWSKPLPLQNVPPILFSEAMRDLDLVVSVAHRGGIDPEGSASTIEMRAALIREVCAALGLTNVRLQSTHAIITGALGEYSLHLGSGSVHLLPGGALCIIPVHAQQRGRVFLPFADDDPKTAEIVSKVLLLARDSEIKDPLILEQIYARA